MLQERIDALGVIAVAGFMAQIGAPFVRVSCIPCTLASDVPGIQSQPPERAVEPPKRGSFSTIRTFRPAVAAVIAAAMPDAPDPTTNTSQSY